MFRRLSARLGFAFRGLWLGIRQDQSFAEHFVCAGAVFIAGVLLRTNLAESCLLAFCVFSVLTAEMFNTAFEQLAKTIDQNHNPQLGAALDMSAAAVLLASAGSAVVGSVIFSYRLGILLAWWPAN